MTPDALEQRVADLEAQLRTLRRRDADLRAGLRGVRGIATAALVAFAVIVPLAAQSYPDIPNAPVAGQPILASEVDANFQHVIEGITALEERVTALEDATPPRYVNPQTLAEYSIVGSFCGFTATTNGNLGGYAAGKDMCEAVLGCSPSAHMCSIEEARRYVATGSELPTAGWVTSQRAALNDWNGEIEDCGAWTNASQLGLYMEPNGQTWESACNNDFSVLCCD